jgi:hypothetical protein
VWGEIPPYHPYIFINLAIFYGTGPVTQGSVKLSKMFISKLILRWRKPEEGFVITSNFLQ